MIQFPEVWVNSERSRISASCSGSLVALSQAAIMHLTLVEDGQCLALVGELPPHPFAP